MKKNPLLPLRLIVTLLTLAACDGAENVAVQTDGRILLGGFAANGLATRFALARVTP
jgi:hypothetical protein